MLEPDFALMSAPQRLGVMALALGGGATLAFVGTFAHQSLPPVGVEVGQAPGGG